MANDPKKKLNWAMLGSSGLEHYSGYIKEDFVKSLNGKPAAEAYEEIACNSTVSSAILQTFGLLVNQTPTNLVPGVEDEEESLQAVEFITGAMSDMEHSFDTVEDEFLTALKHGHAELEVCHKVRGGLETRDPKRHSKFTDGKYGWRSMRLRNQRTIQRWVMEGDKAVGFEQQGFTDSTIKTATVKLANCVQFRMSEVLDNPEGKSLLRGVRRPWHFIQNLEELEAISLERFGAGLPVGFIPPALFNSSNPDDAEIIAELMDALSNVRLDTGTGVLWPAPIMNGQETGYDFKLMTSGGVVDFDKAIRRWQSREAMVLFGDFILLGHDKVGSFSLSDRKTSIAALAIGSIKDRFCRTFTEQAIWPLCEVNGFSRESWPSLQHGDVEVPDIEAIGNFINTMIGANVLTIGPELEEYVRTIGGLPKASMQTFDRPKKTPKDDDDVGDVDGEVVPQDKKHATGIAINYLVSAMQKAEASGRTQLAAVFEEKIKELVAGV